LMKQNAALLEANLASGLTSANSTMKMDDKLKIFDSKFVKQTDPVRSLSKERDDMLSRMNAKTVDRHHYSPRMNSRESPSRTKSVSALKDWLSSLGFAQVIERINMDCDVIEEFRDGLILCKILEKLEMKEIPGIIVKPKTNASKLVNIRKCLQLLAKRPGVNPHYLNIEDRILNGEGQIIRDLLWNIREAYKFINKCLTKNNTSRGASIMNSNEKRGKRSDDVKVYMPEESYILNPEERKRMIVPAKYSKN